MILFERRAKKWPLERSRQGWEGSIQEGVQIEGCNVWTCCNWLRIQKANGLL
jgi:hypothetical protein